MTLLLLFLLLLLNEPSKVTASSCDDDELNCVYVRTPSNMTVEESALTNHVISNVTNTSEVDCLRRCVGDCRCTSYNMKNTGTECELNSETKESSPQDMKPREGFKYKGIQLKFDENCNPSSCMNMCCVESFCQNGGTCVEVCEDPVHRFRCQCSHGWSGKYCQDCSNCDSKPCQNNGTCESSCGSVPAGSTSLTYKCSCPPGFSGLNCEYLPKSCLDYKNRTSNLSQETVFDAEKNNYTVLCDDTTESDWVWTLVTSVSKVNVPLFKTMSLIKDFPVDEDSPNWDQYRLSHSRMSEIKTASTHWRVTCSFNSNYIRYVDYIRGNFEAIDPVKTARSGQCIHIEYMDVTGVSCSDCTVALYNSGLMFHIDLYITEKYCGLTIPDGQCGGAGQDVFGLFSCPRPGHRCSNTDASTTNFWFGGRR